MVQVVRTPRGGFGLGGRRRYGDAPTHLRSFRRLSYRRTKRSKSGFDLVFSSKRPEQAAPWLSKWNSCSGVAGELV
jgi:hypothetical protein